MRKFLTFFAFAIIFSALLLSSCEFLSPAQQVCAVHKDLNRDSVCDTCGKAIPVNCTNHTDADHNGKCDTNGCTAELAVFHTDANHDGICDAENCTFAIEVVHTDVNNDGECDGCGKVLEKEPCEECADSDGDGKCDECRKEINTEDDTIHTCDDADRDGKCDECALRMDGAIEIIKDGATEFKIVVQSGLGSNVAKSVDDLVKDFRKVGVKISVVDDSAVTATEYEILIGEVASRADRYHYDIHTLGPKGYAVSIIGNKIVISGGSVDAIPGAIEAFKSRMLGFGGDVLGLENRVVYKDDSFAVVQSDYRVSSVKLYGRDMKDFTIAVDGKNSAALAGAHEIQSVFYNYVGYWLPIVDLSEAKDSIIIKIVEKTGGEGFYVNISEKNITLSSEFVNDIARESAMFFNRHIKVGSGDINFTSADDTTVNVRDVFYKDFGAVGDGKTDDFAAIIAAHEYANAEEGHKVYADRNAKYYIGSGHFKGAIVKTDTDLRNAEFIIDDSQIDKDSKKGSVYERQVPIFSINSSVPSVKYSGDQIPSSITKDATNIGIAPGYKAMVLIYNSNHKNYIRVGANSNSGQSQQEVVLVDEEGNIEPSTSLMWDYETISYYLVYYVEDEPITLSGGSFTTVYNQAPSVYEQYGRSIWIYRSNVTVKNLSHVYTGEGETGCPSNGIVVARNCYNTLIDNVEVDAPKSFIDSNAGVGMGSYELSAKHCINITWQNCTQIDFFADEEKTRAKSGGMMATNHCKNMFYLNNILSSFDSHTGAQNITIKGCQIEHINCIGAGEILVEDTVVHGMYQKAVIILRADYGSLWMGNATFRNVTLKVGENRSAALMKLNWANHDFGYATSMPTNVLVDNFKLESTYPFSNVAICNFQGSDTSSYKFWNSEVPNSETGEMVKNLNPYKVTEKLYIKNNYGNYNFTLLPDMPTEIIDLGCD